MKINVISIFPQMFEALDYGICGRAIQKKALELVLTNPRDFSDNAYRRVDDRPYGGGPGMVMMAPPLSAALDAVNSPHKTGPVIYLSPKGQQMVQTDVASFAEQDSITLLTGRYEGIDERIITSRVDQELSIGDYILAGGEFAAMVVIEAVVRLLPGVLGNEESAKQESFSDGLLEHPHFTRPESFEDMSVPEVLLSGDHQKIAAWRKQQALAISKIRRPDLLQSLK